MQPEAMHTGGNGRVRVMMESYRLSNNLAVPKLGFGTYKATEGTGAEVVALAVESGYRYFDTASFYQNEEAIGEALRSAAVRRDEVQIATKVWKADMGYAQTKESLEASLVRLKMDYVDFFLIHWPKTDPEDTQWEERLLETWRAMEELLADGKTKGIGVSNFLTAHLTFLLAHANIRPVFNQIEFHPGYLQQDTVDFCQQEGIQVQAWSPLGRRRVLEDSLILRLAEQYNKSAAQICLRFALQKGVMPLPKATVAERMAENLSVFDFEIMQKDMALLENMPQTGWSGEHPDRARVYFS